MKPTWTQDQNLDFRYSGKTPPPGSVIYADAMRVRSSGDNHRGFAIAIYIDGDSIVAARYHAGSAAKLENAIWRRAWNFCPSCGGNAYSCGRDVLLLDLNSIAEVPHHVIERFSITKAAWDARERWDNCYECNGEYFREYSHRVHPYCLRVSKTQEAVEAFRKIKSQAIFERRESIGKEFYCVSCLKSEVSISQKIEEIERNIDAEKKRLEALRKELQFEIEERESESNGYRKQKAIMRLESLRSRARIKLPSSVRISAQASLLTSSN